MTTGDDAGTAGVQRRVLRASAWGLGLALIAMPVSLAVTAILAHSLGVGGFGKYALLAFAIPTVAGLSDLGLLNSFNYRAARAFGQHDLEAVSRAGREALTWALVRLPIVVIVAALLLGDLQATLAFCCGTLCTTFAAGASVTLQASLQFKILTVAAFISGLVGGGVAIATALAGGDAALVFACGTGAQSVATSVQFQLRVPTEFSRRSLLRPARPSRIREDFSFGVVTFLSGQLIETMTSRSELLFFGRSQRVDRGVYAAAWTAGNRITIPLDALYGALGSTLTVVASDEDRLDRGFSRTLRLTAALIGLSAAPAMVAATALVTVIFPSSFENVVVPVVMLTGTSLLISALHPISSYYFATRAIRATFWSAIVGAISNIVLSATLVPTYGLSGAVVANCGGCILFGVALVTPLMRNQSSRGRVLTYAAGLLAPITFSTAWISAALGGGVDGLNLGLAAAGATIQTVGLARTWPYLHDEDVAGLVDAFPMNVQTPVRVASRVLRTRPSLDASD